MKKNQFIFYFFSLLFFIFLFQMPLKAFKLSEKAQISIITGAPGEDLYAVFGHSGIRVYDSFYGLDVMYNYGTFDFDEPNFMGKFIQGRLNYSLSKENYAAFLAFYQSQGRPVYEQILNINLTQKQAILDFLENNFLPKNRYYLYDFFYDNCSTRVRDVLAKSLEKKLVFGQSSAPEKFTFRDFLAPYLSEPWLNVGITLILGLPADKKPNYSEQMFLPNKLQNAFDNAKIINEKGESVPLVIITKQPVGEFIVKKVPVFTPTIIFSTFFLLFALVSYLGFKNGHHSFLLDGFLFGLLGLIGIFFMGMGIFTDHKAVQSNLNVVWALPTHFLVVWFFLKKTKPTWLSLYFGINLFLIGLLLAVWVIFPQRLHFSLIPIFLIIGLRSFKLYSFLKKALLHK